MPDRKATRHRETRESNIHITVSLDGTGECRAATGNGMLDHLLDQLARHSMIDLEVDATADLRPGWHHLVEDTGITLGQALREALGDGAGIVRMGHALVPLDESLAQVAIDLGGRGYAVLDLGLRETTIGDLPGDLVRHFLESLAAEGKFAIHARVLEGINPHHKAEAVFKALARALGDAVCIEPRRIKQVPSTKGTIND